MGKSGNCFDVLSCNENIVDIGREYFSALFGEIGRSSFFYTALLTVQCLFGLAHHESRR